MVGRARVWLICLSMRTAAHLLFLAQLGQIAHQFGTRFDVLIFFNTFPRLDVPSINVGGLFHLTCGGRRNCLQLTWGNSLKGIALDDPRIETHPLDNDGRIRSMISAGAAVNGSVPTVIRNSSVPRPEEKIVAYLV